MNNHRMLDVNRDSHPNADRGAIGVLGVDWSEGNLGELQSLTELLQQQQQVSTTTTTVRHLTYSHCLGRATEVTPVNVYRRMRMRCRQIENTMQGLGSSSSNNVQEITVRFTITTRQGTQATVETLHASPTAMSPQFSPRLRDYLLRNQLVHQAIALAEPEQDNNNSSNTLLEQDNHHCSNDDTHHATWGRAVIRLVEMRDLDISASALFTLLQKCPDYIPAGTVVPQRSKQVFLGGNQAPV